MKIQSGAGQVINMTVTLDSSAALSKGDIIRAQVISVDKNEMVLKLPNGRSLHATTLVSIGVNLGDFLELKVTGEDNGKLIMETTKNMSAKTSDEDGELQKELIKMGLAPDTKSMAMAKELKQLGISITRSLMQNSMAAYEKMGESGAEKAAFMATQNIKPTPQNIQSLTNLLDSRLKIGSGLKGIFDEILSQKELVNVERIAKTLEKISGDLANKDNQNSKVLPFEYEGDRLNEISQANAKTQAAAPGRSESAYPLQPEKEADKTANGDKKIELLVKNLVQDMTKLQKENTAPQQGSITDPSASVLGQMKGKVENFLKQAKAMGMTTSKESIDAFMPLFEKSGLSVENIKKLLMAGIAKSDGEVPDMALDTDSKQQVLKQLNQLYVKVTADLKGDDIRINDLYKGIDSLLDAAREAIAASSLPNREELINRMDHMQGNLKFMNEIAQNSTYIQIPLMMNDKNTTGELFILKRDKRKNVINPEDTTLYISLDTQNMGLVDTLVNVNKKNLSINMRVVNQKIVDFMRQKSLELYQIMQEKGMKVVDFKIRIRDLESDLVHIQKMAAREQETNMAGIDIKL